MLSYYSPISKQPIVSKVKVLEKVFSLLKHLMTVTSFKQLSLGLRYRISITMRLAYYDTLLACDSGHYTYLVLLDLTNIFDTVDHHILIANLNQLVGIQHAVLDWKRWYLTK